MKLNSVISSPSSGNDKAAKNKLDAFINEINAQAGKKITQAEAGQLISEARDVLSFI